MADRTRFHPGERSYWKIMSRSHVTDFDLTALVGVKRERRAQETNYVVVALGCRGRVPVPEGSCQKNTGLGFPKHHSSRNGAVTGEGRILSQLSSTHLVWEQLVIRSGHSLC